MAALMGVELGNGAVATITELVRGAEENALRATHAEEEAIAERVARLEAENTARVNTALAEEAAHREAMARLEAERKDKEMELRTTQHTLSRAAAEGRAWELAADRDRVEAEAHRLERERQDAIVRAEAEAVARCGAEQRIRDLEALHAAEVAARQLAETRAWEIAADRDAERLAREVAERRAAEFDLETRHQAHARLVAEERTSHWGYHTEVERVARLDAEHRAAYAAQAAEEELWKREELQAVARAAQAQSCADHVARLAAEDVAVMAEAEALHAQRWAVEADRSHMVAHHDAAIRQTALHHQACGAVRELDRRLEAEATAWRTETAARQERLARIGVEDPYGARPLEVVPRGLSIHMAVPPPLSPPAVTDHSSHALPPGWAPYGHHRASLSPPPRSPVYR